MSVSTQKKRQDIDGFHSEILVAKKFCNVMGRESMCFIYLSERYVSNWGWNSFVPQKINYLSELLIRLVISLSQQLTKDNRCMSRQVGGVWTSLVAYSKDSQMPSFVDEYLIPKKSKMFIVNNPAIWLDKNILNNQNLWSKIFHEKSEIDNRRNTEWKQEKHPRENNKH